MRKLFVAAALLAVFASHVEARSLDAIRARGVLGLCAHPNALPFSSKAGDPPGFQIELARAIATRIGVAMEPDWVVTGFQIRAANCDIMLDTIDDHEAQEESNLKTSKPYYRTGAALVVPAGSKISSLAGLNSETKVGVLVGSTAAMALGERHVGISVFGFEDDALDGLANHEVDAVMVTPAAVGYYNLHHPDHPLQIIGLDERDPGLAWNVSVGMVKPDADLRAAIDAALASLAADGTIAQIYSHYGITLLAPK